MDAQAALQQNQVPRDPSNRHVHRHAPHVHRRVQRLRVLEARAKHVGELGDRVPFADQYPELWASSRFLGPVRRLEDPAVDPVSVRVRARVRVRCRSLSHPKQVERWHGGARRTRNGRCELGTTGCRWATRPPRRLAAGAKASHAPDASLARRRSQPRALVLAGADRRSEEARRLRRVAPACRAFGAQRSMRLPRGAWVMSILMREPSPSHPSPNPDPAGPEQQPDSFAAPCG